MNKILKWILIISGVGILVYSGLWINSIISFAGAFDTNYSKKDLIENYDLKYKEINDLCSYVNSIVPQNKIVEIEFDGKNKLAYFHITKTNNNIESYINKQVAYYGWTRDTFLKTLKIVHFNTANYNSNWKNDIKTTKADTLKTDSLLAVLGWRRDSFLEKLSYEPYSSIDTKRNWHLEISSTKTDSLLTTLGWTNETLRILKQKLEKANCISVENGNPATIGFQRSGMGKYSYKVFKKPLTDSLKNKYDDGCTYIFYKNNIVLEYGGGAIGSQCFEGYEIKEKQKDLKLNK